MKDNFSGQADIYAKYRPQYPDALFDFITGLVHEKKLAWDCGTGNGQTAIQLARYFGKVYATDISARQIENAYRRENIVYEVAAAEQTGIRENSVDLITVSQALHWFDFDKFYAEVRRVAKPGAVIAVWTYSLLQIDPVTDALIHDHHFGTLEHYWDKERKYVDDGYQSIPFPFEQISTPVFNIELFWDTDELEGYLNTWSALQKFSKANNYNPVPELMEKIRQRWPVSEKRKILFPIHLKMAVVK